MLRCDNVYYRPRIRSGPDLQSSKPEANVLKCLQETPGDMVHKLSAGSSAQVLAHFPDFRLSSFKHAFVGGWLYEDLNHPNLVVQVPVEWVGSRLMADWPREDTHFFVLL